MIENGRTVNGDRRAAMRKAVIQLVAGVVLLDVVALVIWYGAGVAYHSQQTRMTFTVVWTIATAVTVGFLLRRVRVIRMGR
jgi:uncharacterized membrane protein